MLGGVVSMDILLELLLRNEEELAIDFEEDDEDTSTTEEAWLAKTLEAVSVEDWGFVFVLFELPLLVLSSSDERPPQPVIKITINVRIR